MNKRILAIFGGALVLGFVIYLSWMPAQRHGSKEPNKPQPPKVTEPSSSMKVTLYFPNSEYIRTGDNQVERVIPVQREFPKTEGEALAQAVMVELANPPKGGETALERIKVLETRLSKGTAYVNLSGQQLYGGSLEETLLIEQIVRTLTALPGIKNVQFLVDGEPAETLMGHYGVESPLTLNDL